MKSTTDKTRNMVGIDICCPRGEVDSILVGPRIRFTVFCFVMNDYFQVGHKGMCRH